MEGIHSLIWLNQQDDVTFEILVAAEPDEQGFQSRVKYAMAFKLRDLYGKMRMFPHKPVEYVFEEIFRELFDRFVRGHLNQILDRK